MSDQTFLLSCGILSQSSKRTKVAKSSSRAYISSFLHQKDADDFGKVASLHGVQGRRAVEKLPKLFEHIDIRQSRLKDSPDLTGNDLTGNKWVSIPDMRK